MCNEKQTFTEFEIAEMQDTDLDARLERRAARRRARNGRYRKPLVISLLFATTLMVAFISVMAAPQDPAVPADSQKTSQAPVVFVYNTNLPEWEIAEDDRELVGLAIMAVARGESEFCMKAVAQTIRNTCEDEKISVSECIRKYRYPIFASEISEEAAAAVDAVVRGEEAVKERLHCFYNPGNMESNWHEEQEYIVTIGSVRFFR